MKTLSQTGMRAIAGLVFLLLFNNCGQGFKALQISEGDFASIGEFDSIQILVSSPSNDLQIKSGDTLLVSVVVTTTAEIQSFVWQKLVGSSFEDVAGSTNILRIENAQINNSGRYRAKVVIYNKRRTTTQTNYSSELQVTVTASSPTPRPSPTPISSPIPTPIPTPTPAPSPSAPPVSPTPTATPRPSPTPTATPRPSPTPTATPRPSPTPVPPPQPCQGANCLRDAAAALAPGQTAAFDITTFGSGWVNGYDLAWNHRLNWDPNRRQLHMQGKRHASVGNNARYIRYSGDSNTWELMSSIDGPLWPLGRQSGHNYDASTVDTSTGRFYYLPLYSSQIAYFDPMNTYNGQYRDRDGTIRTHSNFHPHWFGAGMNITPQSNWNTTGPFALAYHPNLFGNGAPGFVVPSAAFGGVSFYDHINDRWSMYRLTTVNATNGAAVYVPGMDAVVYSYGASNPTMYGVRRNNDVFPMGSAPSGGNPGGSSGGDVARLMDGPNGTAVLLENPTSGPGRVWQYRMSDNSWVNTGVTHRFSELSGNDDKIWITVFIPEYDIYLMIAPLSSSGTLGRPRCYLWKPNF